MTEEEAEALDAYGLCNFEGAEVLLNAKQNREHLVHTYYHELAHALLKSIGRDKLARDEALVDALGGALHHYIKTANGTLRKGRK
jgi:Zn-dependent peptidase ImmA (M78 family)